MIIRCYALYRCWKLNQRLNRSLYFLHYYVYLQVQTANEFDCLFVCDIKYTAIVYSDSGSNQSRCSVLIDLNTAQGIQIINGPRTEGACYICPKAFRQYFKDKVASVLENERQAGEERFVNKINYRDIRK